MHKITFRFAASAVALRAMVGQASIVESSL